MNIASMDTDGKAQNGGPTANVVSFLYDVPSWYPSFDFIGALAIAESCRKLWYPQSEGLEVIVVTGKSPPTHGLDFQGVKFESSYEDPDDHYRQRLHKVVLPQADLVPSVKSVTVFDTKLGQKPSSLGRQYIYPDGVDVDHLDLEPMVALSPRARLMFAVGAATDIRVVENSKVALNDARAYAKRLTGTDRPLVMTLRANKFSGDRARDNSESYLEIAERLAERHPVVVIPDTTDVPGGINTRVPVAYEAAMCVRLRSALYEVARANFCGNSGPALLVQFNKNCAYYHSDLTSGAYTKEYWDGQWLAASWFLETGLFDRSGRALKRLEVNKNGPNFYAAEALHQVVDLGALTYEKAERFLAYLARWGR